MEPIVALVIVGMLALFYLVGRLRVAVRRPRRVRRGDGWMWDWGDGGGSDGGGSDSGGSSD